MAEPSMPDRLPGLVGYVLAGGRSSRMGQDKAAMRIGGRTLLDLALEKLRPVCEEVVVVGPGMEGVRGLVDAHPGCGPMGGIEVALADGGGDWAVFLPVDMPLLPGGLLQALVAVWGRSSDVGARVCFAVADGRPQPLISLVHRGVLPWVRDALERGELRVRAVLEGAAADLAREREAPPGAALRRTEVRVSSTGLEVRIGEDAVWWANDAEWSARALWFSNLNTPEEFREAEGLVRTWPVGEDEDAGASADSGDTRVNRDLWGEQHDS